MVYKQLYTWIDHYYDDVILILDLLFDQRSTCHDPQNIICRHEMASFNMIYQNKTKKSPTN